MISGYSSYYLLLNGYCIAKDYNLGDAQFHYSHLIKALGNRVLKSTHKIKRNCFITDVRI